MVNQNQTVDQHVGELISGLVDGELTQQQRQLVMLHCESCEECRDNLERLRALRQRVGKAALSEVGEDQWRETMTDPTVQITRGLGWFFFIAGIVAILAVGLFLFIATDDMSVWEKLMVAAVYGGLATLFISVLRQRLLERKTDKYKDVEI